jgi:hypothetical protein
MRNGVVIAGCVALSGLVGLSGCARYASRPAPLTGVGAIDDGPVGPFAPASMRVFPLTQFEVEEDGRARIVLHLEMRDRWGDTVKATGKLRVRLYRASGSGFGPADERQELVWDVDLQDLGLNAALFDPSTRTYRVVLGQLPAWATEMVQAGGRSVTLVAVLITRDPDGETVSLRDVYRLEG